MGSISSNAVSCSPFSGSSCGKHSAISAMICLISLVSFSMETFSSTLKSGFIALHNTIWDKTDPRPCGVGLVSRTKKTVILAELLITQLVFVLTEEAAHVHWNGHNEPKTLVELSLEELAQHVEANQLVVINNVALGESAERKRKKTHITWYKENSFSDIYLSRFRHFINIYLVYI